MNIFREYCLSWWELGLLKLSLLSLGILVGGMLPGVYASGPSRFVLAVLFVIPAVYLSVRALRQASATPGQS